MRVRHLERQHLMALCAFKDKRTCSRTGRRRWASIRTLGGLTRCRAAIRCGPSWCGPTGHCHELVVAFHAARSTAAYMTHVTTLTCSTWPSISTGRAPCLAEHVLVESDAVLNMHAWLPRGLVVAPPFDVILVAIRVATKAREPLSKDALHLILAEGRFCRRAVGFIVGLSSHVHNAARACLPAVPPPSLVGPTST